MPKKAKKALKQQKIKIKELPPAIKEVKVLAKGEQVSELEKEVKEAEQEELRKFAADIEEPLSSPAGASPITFTPVLPISQEQEEEPTQQERAPENITAATPSGAPYTTTGPRGATYTAPMTTQQTPYQTNEEAPRLRRFVQEQFPQPSSQQLFMEQEPVVPSEIFRSPRAQQEVSQPEDERYVYRRKEPEEDITRRRRRDMF